MRTQQQLRRAILDRVAQDAAYGSATSRNTIVAHCRKLGVPREQTDRALARLVASPGEVVHGEKLWRVGEGKLELAVEGMSYNDLLENMEANDD